ncbi:MAG TPA: hypothetical protein V6D12_18090 [Candidatus Obscuribacterales bacterium]
MIQSTKQTLLAVIIGGIISFATTWLNNRYQLNREKQNWYREQLYENYRKCISLLIKIQNLNSSAENLEEKRVFLTELKEYLVLLQINYPSNKIKEYQELETEINEYLKVFPNVYLNSASQKLLNRVIELLKNDLRLKV